MKVYFHQEVRETLDSWSRGMASMGYLHIRNRCFQRASLFQAGMALGNGVWFTLWGTAALLWTTKLQTSSSAARALAITKGVSPD